MPTSFVYFVWFRVGIPIVMFIIAHLWLLGPIAILRADIEPYYVGFIVVLICRLPRLAAEARREGWFAVQ